MKAGQYIIYRNGERYEIGKIKRVTEDGAFVYYSEGDTAAKTPFECMHPLTNEYVIKETSLGGEQLTIQPKRGRWIYCEDSMADCVDGYRCDQCGFFTPWDYQHKSIDYIKDYNFCPNCGSYNGGENDT